MNIALIVAGGNGSRMGNTIVPKQFMIIKNKPIFMYSLEAFEKNKLIDAIVLVCQKDYMEKANAWIKEFNLNKVKLIVEGGTSRQASVYHGLLKMQDIGVQNDDIILIHDAARPLVNKQIIDSNVEMCLEHNACLTVVPSSDTILRSVDKKTILEVQSREEQFCEQTPQTFRYGIIKEAHENAINNSLKNITDDCRLVKQLGQEIYLVHGSKLNFKITTMDDLTMFSSLLK